MMEPEKWKTSKYNELTVPLLKAELKKRKAKLSGRKKDLIERWDLIERR